MAGSEVAKVIELLLFEIGFKDEGSKLWDLLLWSPLVVCGGREEVSCIALAMG